MGPEGRQELEEDHLCSVVQEQGSVVHQEHLGGDCLPF